MELTNEQLEKIAIHATDKTRARYLSPLNDTFKKYRITTPLRIAAFLAQVLHESGSLYYVKELADGKAYEGRKDLGNTQPGDGVRYKGRGLIQITGRYNYAALSKALGVDLLSRPELLEQPKYAVASAGWFWDTKKLNDLADLGDFVAITKKINGGTNGLKERQAFYQLAKTVLVS